MATDNMSTLADELVQVIVAEIGFTPTMARAVVEPIIAHLAARYGGDRIYFPARRREYPIDDIRKAADNSASTAEVCERFGISRATLYRILRATGGTKKARARSRHEHQAAGSSCGD